MKCQILFAKKKKKKKKKKKENMSSIYRLLDLSVASAKC